MPQAPAVLFTAFEPSGDALAAPVIAQLKREHPNQTIHALGGPKMAAAGAQLIEATTGRAVMLGGALKHAWSHRQRVGRLKDWLASNPIAVHVPTDSPAANWSICAAVRRMQPQARIVHLAMPQLWAWASWRIRRLRRLTDHVLCLLPFEPDWLGARGVKGTFVGHPVFDRPPSPPRPADAPPNLALLPGSRASEIVHNWPTMLEVFLRLRRAHPTLTATIAAAHDDAQAQVRAIVAREVGDWPQGLDLRTGVADEVLDGSDLALVVSGTATLQVAARHKPMVVIFNTSRWTWSLVGWWLIQTRTFALPNLVHNPPGSPPGNNHIVPEFVPHFGAVDPVYDAVARLVEDPGERQAVTSRLAELRRVFEGRDFARESATLIASVGSL